MDKEFLEELRGVLDYNSEIGEFTWKVSESNRVRVGSLAGCVNSEGRLQIRFKRKLHLASRLAWLMIHGKWPEQMIDHIDGNPLNNRIENLRDVSRAVNNQNQRKAQMHSKTRLLGASPHKSGKFDARISVNGKQQYLGIFTTAEEAHSAYLAAKRGLHEGNTL